MSIAAYNRGSAVNRKLADDKMPSHIATLMSDINAAPKAPTAVAPWATCTVSQDHHRNWWITDDKGFGFCYKTLRLLCARWAIDLTGYDESKRQFIAEPRKEKMAA